MSQVGMPPAIPYRGADTDPGADVSSVQSETAAAPQGGVPQRLESAPQRSDAESRMQAMRAAIQRSGGILLLDRFHLDGSLLTGTKPTRAAANAQKNVLLQVEQVKQAFDRLDALNPALFKKSGLEEPTSAIVENAFTQLDALDNQLAEFEKIAGASASTRNLRDACMARLCELSRFVGAMQAEAMTEAERQQSGIHGFEALKAGASVKEMLGDLALSMHGNDPATLEVSDEAESLFSQVRVLKANFNSLSAEEALDAAKTIRERALSLVARTDEILDPPAPGESKSIPGEPALFRAIGDYAKAAVADMDGLRGELPHTPIIPLLGQIFPPANMELLAECDQLPDYLKNILTSLMEEIERHAVDFPTALKNGTLTGQEVREAFNLFSQYEGMVAKASLCVMKDILRGAYRDINTIRQAFIEEMQDFFSGPMTIQDTQKCNEMADKLWDAMQELKQDSARRKRPYLLLRDFFENDKLLLQSPVVARNVLEAADAVDRSKNPIPVERYLPLLFEQKVKLSTLVTAAMYNIPPEHLEVRPDAATETGSRVLGQGVANTVRLCQYTDDLGNPFSLVFKPEAPARAGFEKYDLFSMGYRESIRTANLNVASSTVAKLLGTPQVLTTSTLGFHKGEPGLFMSHASGKTAYDLRDDDDLPDIVKILKQNGKQDIMLGNLQRELCRLEWADMLSAQGDRHGDNYLVDINTEDGSVTVTGIDNDASFGERMIGISTMDLTDMPGVNAELGDRDDNLHVVATPWSKCEGEINGCSPPYELREGRLLVHFDEIQSPELYGALNSLLGRNQMFLPSHIDRTTYDNLMALKPDSYKESLQPLLSPEALEAAVMRLKSAQNHAEWLKGQGRCLDEEQWRDPGLLAEAGDACRSDRHQGDGDLGLGFFARDFQELIPGASNSATA